MKKSAKFVLGIVAVALILWLSMTGLRNSNINGNSTLKNETLLTFSTIMKGNDIKILVNKSLVIRDKKEWTKLWTEIYPTQTIAPSIKFNKLNIIASFGGNKPTGGYDRYISKIRDFPDRIEVLIEDVRPNERCFVSKAETQPYHLAVIDRNDKPIKFIYEERVINC